MTSWDDVQAARDTADAWMKASNNAIPPQVISYAILAVQSEIRALELTLDMKLTAYPNSEATLGFGG